MMLFTAEVERLRTRLSDPEFAAAAAGLRAMAEDALSRPVLVPPAGIAGWNLHYVCPDHAVPLAFAWESPRAHRCPVDGRLHESPLLDAAWWRRVNTEAMNGAFSTALLWQATGEEPYLNRCRAILLAYAERYPGYQVHGGIPFNGPGKANQQTLCEATWIISLAWAFDLIRAGLSSSDAALIENRLFLEAAGFLVEHQEAQLHNHQCWIASAIGLIGLVTERPELVETAVDGEWGIRRQLRDGVLEGGFWLEGSIGYHIHALTALLKFVQTARGDLREDPALRAMLTALRPFVQPDGTFPALNDVTQPQSLASLIPHLEIAYGWSGDPVYGSLLHEALGRQPRRSLEALLFGRDRVAAGPPLPPPGHCISAGSGVSILRNGSLYLLVKHGDGGGEHDHADRLGLSLVGRGERLAPDIGTVFYGHPLHWDWYKSTFAHNTVALGGQNQPPARAGVTRFAEAEGGGAVLQTWAEWPRTAPGAYAGARFRRLILWAPDAFVDVCHVRAGRPERIEYIFHCPGRVNGQLGGGERYGFITDLTERPVSAPLRWEFSRAALEARFRSAGPTRLLTGVSPDNPPAGRRSTVLLRQEGVPEALFVAAFRVTAPGDSGLMDLSVTGGGEILLSVPGRTHRWQIEL